MLSRVLEPVPKDVSSVSMQTAPWARPEVWHDGMGLFFTLKSAAIIAMPMFEVSLGFARSYGNFAAVPPAA